MKPQPAFDAYAENYDQAFTQTNIGRLQRAQVWQALHPFIKKPLNILEVNCGTGEDAIQLAQLGHQVIATDISENMIKACRDKASKVKGLKNLHFLSSGFLQLSQKLPQQQFDLIFSNFGGLNCIGPEDTRTFSRICRSLLKPDGKLFLVYISKACRWEQLYFSYKKEFEKARRRSAKGPITSTIEGHPVSVWYYSTSELTQLYADNFSMIRNFPVGLFVPPSYLEDLFEKHSYLLKVLGWLDQRLRWRRWGDYGDHVGLVLRAGG